METLYLVINDGKIVAYSNEREVAEVYAEEMNDKGAEESAEEYGYEPGSAESYYQNGYDGGLYETEKVTIPEDQDDEFEFEAGGYTFTIGDLVEAEYLKE